MRYPLSFAVWTAFKYGNTAERRFLIERYAFFKALFLTPQKFSSCTQLGRSVPPIPTAFFYDLICIQPHAKIGGGIDGKKCTFSCAVYPCK